MVSPLAPSATLIADRDVRETIRRLVKEEEAEEETAALARRRFSIPRARKQRSRSSKRVHPFRHSMSENKKGKLEEAPTSSATSCPTVLSALLRRLQLLETGSFKKHIHTEVPIMNRHVPIAKASFPNTCCQRGNESSEPPRSYERIVASDSTRAKIITRHYLPITPNLLTMIKLPFQTNTREKVKDRIERNRRTHP